MWWAEAVLLPIITSLGFFILVGWLYWIHHRRKIREIEAQENFYPHLMQKFENARDFADFLATEQGERLIRAFTPHRRTFKERTLFWINLGIVILFFGVSFLLMGVFGVEDRDIIIPGFIFTLPGLGFIISGGLSLALGRRWGLNGSTKGGGNRVPPSRTS